jgi:hypothetical protein
VGGVFRGGVRRPPGLQTNPSTSFGRPLYVFDIPAVDDPRILVSIPVPVKGRKTPLVIRVPRFDFIGEDQHDILENVGAEIAEANPGMGIRKLQRLTDLAALKLFLPAKDYTTCEGLTSGQLQAVMIAWAEGSTIPLGELLASAESSTGNTEAHSSTTSTHEDGQGETSDAA